MKETEREICFGVCLNTGKRPICPTIRGVRTRTDASSGGRFAVTPLARGKAGQGGRPTAEQSIVFALHQSIDDPPVYSTYYFIAVAEKFGFLFAPAVTGPAPDCLSLSLLTHWPPWLRKRESASSAGPDGGPAPRKEGGRVGGSSWTWHQAFTRKKRGRVRGQWGQEEDATSGTWGPGYFVSCVLVRLSVKSRVSESRWSIAMCTACGNILYQC